VSTLSQVGPTEWPDGTVLPVSRTLPGLLDEIAERTPQAPALVAGRDRLTYADLAGRTLAAAAALSLLGIERGSRVALLATNTAAWHEVAFGALRRGARVDAFNTWVRAYDLQHLLAASAADVLIMVPTVGSTDLLAELRTVVPELWDCAPGQLRSASYPRLRHVVILGGDNLPSGARSWTALLAATTSGDPHGSTSGVTNVPSDLSDPGDVATVVYTSGSTQHPKAVPLVHSMMIENGFGIGERMGLGEHDRVWLGSPLFWSFGIANAAIATMTHGACLVLQERFSPKEAAALMKTEECTAAYLLPSIVDALAVNAGPAVRSLDSLRTGVTIGRPDEVRRVVDELGIAGICNVYGSTETYGNCCVTPHSLPLEDRLVTQGEPLPGVELRIVELRSETVVPVGEPGEIQVRGHVMAGYIDDPSTTAAVITEDGWFRTGDTGLLREDGRVQFLARHSDMIKTSGINVSPAEVESFLSQHPSVVDVAVVGAPHPTKGEVVVAFVSTNAPDLSGQDVIDFCKGAVASYKIPATVVVVSDLPRTSTGKLARKQLLSQANSALESLTAEASARATGSAR
jgi:fatty-acyl-CoA synthase